MGDNAFVMDAFHIPLDMAPVKINKHLASCEIDRRSKQISLMK